MESLQQLLTSWLDPERSGPLLFDWSLRLVAAILVFNMGMATAAHLISGQGNPSAAVKGTILFCGLMFTGPGRYSLDAWLARRRSDGPGQH